MIEEVFGWKKRKVTAVVRSRMHLATALESTFTVALGVTSSGGKFS
jgi:hypothetical protein